MINKKHPEKSLAEQLHELQCQLNHADQCSWYYEKDWTAFQHNLYLEKAQKLLEITNDISLLENIIECLKGN